MGLNLLRNDTSGEQQLGALGAIFPLLGPSLPSAFTLTRASSGTYFDATGTLQTAGTNVARFDYDPATLLPRGLLLEGQATNLFLNSQAAATQGIAVTAQAYTVSFYGSGSITLSGAYSGTLTGTNSTTLATLTFTPTAGTVTCTPSGSALNVQVETGSAASSRIITAGTTVTRAADFCALTSAAFAQYVNAAEGTVVADYTMQPVGIYQQLISLDDGTLTNRVSFAINSNTYERGDIVTGGATQVATLFLPQIISANVSHRGGMSWGSTATWQAIALDGQLNSYGSGTPSMPTTNNFVVGNRNGNPAPFYGLVSKIAIYKTAMPNALLQAVSNYGAALP